MCLFFFKTFYICLSLCSFQNSYPYIFSLSLRESKLERVDNFIGSFHLWKWRLRKVKDMGKHLIEISMGKDKTRAQRS